jgi:hypothetical protein
MCEPVSIGMAIASVAMSAAQAQQQQKGMEQAAAAQSAALHEGFARNQTQLNVRQGQANEQAAAQASERARQALIERGRLQAIGAEGLNVGRMINESEMVEGADLATLEANRAGQQWQSQVEKAGMRAQAVSDFNQIRRPTSRGAMALQVAGSALNAATTYGSFDKFKIPGSG